MISKEFFKALELVANERGLEKEKILEIMGRGLLNAYKKVHNISENARIEFNEDKKVIRCVIQAVYNDNEYEINWRDLKQPMLWRQGWC